MSRLVPPPSPLFKIYAAVDEELKRAMDIHQWPTDPFHAINVVAEELGETQRAINLAVYEDGSRDDIRAEAIQLAAMAIRFIRNLDYYDYRQGKTVKTRHE